MFNSIMSCKRMSFSLKVKLYHTSNVKQNSYLQWIKLSWLALNISKAMWIDFHSNTVNKGDIFSQAMCTNAWISNKQSQSMQHGYFLSRVNNQQVLRLWQPHMWWETWQTSSVSSCNTPLISILDKQQIKTPEKLSRKVCHEENFGVQSVRRKRTPIHIHSTKPSVNVHTCTPTKALVSLTSHSHKWNTSKRVCSHLNKDKSVDIYT